MRTFVRWWLPAIVCVVGVIGMAVGPSDGGVEGGAAIVGAGLSIWLINWLFRVGVSGDREREREDRARAYFDEHGRWPDAPDGEPEVRVGGAGKARR